MLCSMSKDIDHDGADKRYTNNFMKCPLRNGKQICYWCCLRISSIANPQKREVAAEKNPEHYRFVPDDSGRNWNDIWAVCSKCSK